MVALIDAPWLFKLLKRIISCLVSYSVETMVFFVSNKVELIFGMFFAA